MGRHQNLAFYRCCDKVNPTDVLSYPVFTKWLGSRLAQEIHLNQPSTELDQRSNLNRVRTWIICFCVDSSHAALSGKMDMVNLDDYLVRTSVRTWYKSHDNAPYDIALCATSEMLLLLAEFRRSTGFSNELAQRSADVRTVIAAQPIYHSYHAVY